MRTLQMSGATMTKLPLWFILYSKLHETCLHRDISFCDAQKALDLSTGHVKQVMRKLLELKLIVRYTNSSDRRFASYRFVPLSLWSKYRQMEDRLPQALRDLFPLLLSIPHVHVVLLLGSYVRKDFDRMSDVDVLVVADNPERVLDITYGACSSSSIDLHACSPEEFRNSLYPLVQHVVLYEDGTCRGKRLSEIERQRLLRESLEGVQRILNLYESGLVGFHNVFPAIYELVFVDTLLHGSVEQRKPEVLERFFQEHSSLRDLRDYMLGLLRIYEKLMKGRGRGAEGLGREKESRIYGRIFSEVKKHV